MLDSERGRKIRVFVSYANDSPGHGDQVTSLCGLLVECGLEVVFDQWVTGRVIWSEWAENGLLRSDFVLVVASASYKVRVDGDRVPNRGSGALYEARLLRDLVTGGPDHWQPRILPVLLPGHTADAIPWFLLPHTGTWYRVPQISQAGVAELLTAMDVEGGRRVTAT